MKKIKIKVKTRKHLIYSTISLMFILLLMIGLGVARYVESKNRSLLYGANSFYFESDVLTSDTNMKTYVYKTGVNEIKVTLHNYIDQLRNSEVNIKYKVTITDSLGKEVTDSKGNKIKEVSGTLKGKEKSSGIATFSNLKAGTYRVTAVSTEPYSKILEGMFTITEDDNKVYFNVSDAANSPVVQLTVNTVDYDGNIVITWPDGVAPDSTDELLGSANSGFTTGSITVPFDSNSEYVFQFFKSNPKNVFNKGDFKVEGE